MSSSRVTTRDRGAKKLIATVSKEQPRLKVGVFGEPATAKAVDADMTVGDLANVHEFGLGNNPERSFIRAYIDENQARIKAMMARAGAEVAAGRLTPQAALNLVGLKAVGEIQQRMAAGLTPPLTPAYLRKKLLKYPGATNPLIASGQLRQSVTHSITDKDGNPLQTATAGGSGTSARAPRKAKRTLRKDLKAAAKGVRKAKRQARKAIRDYKANARKTVRSELKRFRSEKRRILAEARAVRRAGQRKIREARAEVRRIRAEGRHQRKGRK